MKKLKLSESLKRVCEAAMNEGAGATVTFCFDEKDRDNAGSCDFTFEGTTVKVQNLNIQDYYYGDTAYDGGTIEFNKEEMIDALVKDYTENYGADISKEKIKDIKIVGIQELPNLHYSWGWVRTKLTGDEVLTWNEYNYGHYLPELKVDVYYTDETMEMLYVNVDGKYYPSEEVVEVYNCLGEKEDDEELDESMNESIADTIIAQLEDGNFDTAIELCKKGLSDEDARRIRRFCRIEMTAENEDILGKIMDICHPFMKPTTPKSVFPAGEFEFRTR